MTSTPDAAPVTRACDIPQDILLPPGYVRERKGEGVKKKKTRQDAAKTARIEFLADVQYRAFATYISRDIYAFTTGERDMWRESTAVHNKRGRGRAKSMTPYPFGGSLETEKREERARSRKARELLARAKGSITGYCFSCIR